jgi:predicted molibdopterin-dependent oxidoreductase YjgC
LSAKYAPVARVYTRSGMDRSRLTTPLVRVDGELRPASWEDALDRAAAGFRKTIDDGALVGLFSCSKATNELNYAAQKMSRVALHSNNVDSCNRT